MNAKKLVMLLAVVAIAVGVWFMMSGGDDCMCCDAQIKNEAGEMVDNPDFSADCECCPELEGGDDEEEEEMEEEEMEEEEMEEEEMGENEETEEEEAK